MSIISERSVNYFENFGTECHLLKIRCIVSLVSPNIGDVNVIYTIIILYVFIDNYFRSKSSGFVIDSTKKTLK
jgi:hypothetical protein